MTVSKYFDVNEENGLTVQHYRNFAKDVKRVTDALLECTNFGHDETTGDDVWLITQALLKVIAEYGYTLETPEEMKDFGDTDDEIYSNEYLD